eukprot:1136325-Pelagomonas_calceolata.AAC.4
MWYSETPGLKGFQIRLGGQHGPFWDDLGSKVWSAIVQLLLMVMVTKPWQSSMLAANARKGALLENRPTAPPPPLETFRGA